MANRDAVYHDRTLAVLPEMWFLAAMTDKDDRQAESDRILRRVNREADGAPFGGPGVPEPEDDPLDRLGTRIGRGLGLLVTIFLLLAIIVWLGAASPS